MLRLAHYPCTIKKSLGGGLYCTYMPRIGCPRNSELSEFRKSSKVTFEIPRNFDDIEIGIPRNFVLSTKTISEYRFLL